MKKGEIIEVTIEKLVFGGLGMATVDGLKVFVASSVPGDVAKIKILKKKNTFAEGKIEELTTPSPQRITAKCKHFSVCGGCTWQFLSYKDQLLYKQQIVEETLSHIGGFQGIKVEPIIGCEEPWNYRNKMEFSVAPDEEGLADIGLHPTGYHHDVFTLTECHLPSPRYAEIAAILRDWMRTHNVRLYAQKTDSGFLKHVMIRHNQNAEIMVNFITTQGSLPNLSELKKILSEKDIISIMHTQVHATKGKPTERVTQLISGKEYLEEQLALPDPWGTLHFRIYPEAFFQPNPKQAQLLYTKALELADIHENDTFLDLYCGTGTLGLFASKKAKMVFGIDNVADAIRSAEENAKANNIQNAHFYVGDAALILSSRSLKPTVAIVDPPRAGMSMETVEIFNQLKLDKLVYISCNPTTQARDLKLLCEAGYELKTIQPVDMFPHTYHIENIALLTHSSKSAR